LPAAAHDASTLTTCTKHQRTQERFQRLETAICRRSDAELRLSSSFTACRIGLAAGILHHLTDNQPISLGLPAAWLDLSGVLADDIVDHSFDRGEVGACSCLASLTIAAGSPPSLQTISNTSLAILPEMFPPRSGRGSRRAAARSIGEAKCPCLLV